MPKFHGRIGFGESVETSPGVYTDAISEQSYYGDIIRDSRQLQQATALNENILAGNSISIVGTVYALEHSFAIRYLEWAGELWTVTDVEIQRPRLVLRLGEVYNGPTAAAPISP
jgi:hypothetical protein